MIKRVDVTDIAWVFARKEMLPYNLSTQDVLILCHHNVATNCFGKPQTKFGDL